MTACTIIASILLINISCCNKKAYGNHIKKIYIKTLKEEQPRKEPRKEPKMHPRKQNATEI